MEVLSKDYNHHTISLSLQAEKSLKRLSESLSLYFEENDYIKRIRRDFEKSVSLRITQNHITLFVGSQTRYQKRAVKSVSLPFQTLAKTIQSRIQGSWRLHSCRSLKLFQIKMRKAGGDTLEEMLFEHGEPNFEIEGDDVLNMSVKFNGKHYYQSTSVLGRPCAIFGFSRITYVEGEKLHTVDKNLSNGYVMNQEERFIKNGKLHIVVNRYGMECVRIYERIV